MPVRLVFMGDRRVGTSSLVRRLTYGLYDDAYAPDVTSVSRHCVSVLHPRQTRTIPVQLWDVEGADVRTAMSSAQKAHAVTVLYDVTNRTSFERAQKYLNRVNPRVSAMLVCTKNDLAPHRKVSHEEGRLLAKIHRVDFIEVSSKLNQNVDDVFPLLLSHVPDEYLLGGSSGSSSIADSTIDFPIKGNRDLLRTSPFPSVCTVCHTVIKKHHSNSCLDLRLTHHDCDGDDVFLRAASASGDRHRVTAGTSRPRQYNRSMENLMPPRSVHRSVHSFSS